MKIYKLLKAFTLVAVVLMASCSDFEDTVVASPEVPAGTQGVYFPATNTKAFELEPTDPTQITLTIAREESTGTVSVPVTVEINTDEIFTVPATVNFADGETEKEFTVTFPNAGEGTKYDLKLSVFGDEYVNPYLAALPYLTTSVTRIKWSPVSEPMVYIDGTFSALFGVEFLPMYVEAEKASVTGMVRYRFKNAYDVPSGDGEPDVDGIYDGYPYNATGEFDESNDYYTIIEIDNATNEVFMYANEIGVDWTYGMISIGSVYKNVSNDKAAYPLGKLSGDVITFGASSLYFSMANYNSGGKYPSANPTVIYLTKDAFIAANMKIEDFNNVEYVAVEGEVGEYESAAYSDAWSQTLSKAIDIDAENEESEYIDLYFLSDLYAEGKGVAFYYTEGGKVKIPANQPIGTKVLGKDIYVSQSEEIESSVEINAKGVTIYTLGLMFHFEDGTIVGDFAEKFYYSEDAVTYEKADFLGNFLMTGSSQFSGEPDAEMNVTVAEGDADNSLLISGIDYAEEVVATFDAATSVMSVAPQTLSDVVLSGSTYDATLYTTTVDGDVSTSAAIDLTFNMQGDLVITASSEADGYLIRSEDAGGWLDGYYGMVFSPSVTKSTSINAQNVSKINVHSVLNVTTREESDNVDVNNFKIKGKKDPKRMRNIIYSSVIF